MRFLNTHMKAGVESCKVAATTSCSRKSYTSYRITLLTNFTNVSCIGDLSMSNGSRRSGNRNLRCTKNPDQVSPYSFPTLFRRIDRYGNPSPRCTGLRWKIWLGTLESNRPIHIVRSCSQNQRHKLCHCHDYLHRFPTYRENPCTDCRWNRSPHRSVFHKCRIYTDCSNNQRLCYK